MSAQRTGGEMRVSNEVLAQLGHHRRDLWTNEMCNDIVFDLRRARVALLQVVESSETYGHQLGCSSAEDDGSGCDCILSELALARATAGRP